MRSITRLTGSALNTVSRLLVDAAGAASDYHDTHVRGLDCRRIEADEIRTFTWCRPKNLPKAKAAPPGAGECWTWTALDAESKLLVSYLVGARGMDEATRFLKDMEDRVNGRIQLTTDGRPLYPEAVELAFGGEVDYATLVKTFGTGSLSDGYRSEQLAGSQRYVVSGDPDFDHIGTSYVERHNLTMRMGMRRFTRLTNGFSKRIEKHRAMVSLYAWHYNFVRSHKTLSGATPAMAVGLTPTFHSLEELVELVDKRTPPVKRPKDYRKRDLSFETDPYRS